METMLFLFLLLLINLLLPTVESNTISRLVRSRFYHFCALDTSFLNAKPKLKTKNREWLRVVVL